MRLARFDGFRVDRGGNLWASTAEGVDCYAPDGTRFGKILVPEVVGNVEFGGIKRNRLYVCATTSLYAIFLNTTWRPSETDQTVASAQTGAS